ncbi:hypothetical protein VCHA53O466_140171 [Vibrio chagasii]|nr:hypothetical protein VCHA53O466_140171 [Vibrio chagasii]
MAISNQRAGGSKVHMYTMVEEAWDMVAKGLIEVTTATNQSLCGGYKQLVTKEESKVTCSHCKKKLKNQFEQKTVDTPS